MVVVRAATGVLLLAHGLVHLLYLAPGVPEFSLDRSVVVPSAARRPVGLTLVVVTVAAFALLALAVWGVPPLTSRWPGVALIAALLSAALLIAFWRTALVFGLLIDVALVVVAVNRPAWVADLLGAG